MQTMTLREAARRTSRSVTTLRRYIRSARLVAHKRRGRFGPEYFVSAEALADAGFELAAPARGPQLPAAPGSTALAPLAAVSSDVGIPLSLFQELQMKHEQLLVQYGMVRVSGMRALELKNDLELKQRQLEENAQRFEALRRRFREETTRLNQLLRRVELEQEGRGLEVAALREKVRALELFTRSSATSETIEQQFSEVMEQMRRVERMSGGAPPSGTDRSNVPRASAPLADTDH